MKAACAAAVSLCVLLAGCVSPALGPSSYRGKGQAAVQAALSEVETVRLVIEQLQRARIPTAYADETVSASEQALSSISDSFGSVQPPRQSDEVRSEVSELLDDANDVVGDARVATRRTDRAKLADLAGELHDLADRLRQAEERLS